MIGFEVIATLLLTRVVLPVCFLLLVGEWAHRLEKSSWSKA